MGYSLCAVVEYRRESSHFTFAVLELLRDDKFCKAIAFGDTGSGEDLKYPPRGLPSDMSLGTYEQFVDEEAESASVDNPLRSDLYSPGWLTLPELEDQLALRALGTEHLASDTCAALCAMRELGRHHGSENVRLVFCFC